MNINRGPFEGSEFDCIGGEVHKIQSRSICIDIFPQAAFLYYWIVDVVRRDNQRESALKYSRNKLTGGMTKL